MKVLITEFNVEMKVKNKGVQIDIFQPNGKVRHGDLTITKTKLIWCKGQTHKANGIEVSLEDFIEWIEAQ